MSKWLSPPQIAEDLGVAVEKVHTWIRAGELEAVNISTIVGSRPRWKVSPDAFDRFLDTRRQRQPDKPMRRKRRRELVAFY